MMEKMRSLAVMTTRLRIPPENDGQENIQMIRYGGNISTNNVHFYFTNYRWLLVVLFFLKILSLFSPYVYRNF